MDKVLEVKNLTVAIGERRVIDSVSFDLVSGRVTALVGESGSGKTLTALSVLDLLPEAAIREKGEVIFKGRNIFSLKPEEKRALRGKDIAMLFQEPSSALNPVMRARDQIAEAILTHRKYSSRGAVDRVKELADMVKLSSSAVSRYPHELSGGMCQRVVLAMALASSPQVLILDEPTTALDVSIQKEILDLIGRIQKEESFTTLFITHDFSVVNVIADEICVMKDGLLVEEGTKEEVLKSPSHEYTKQLIDCIPRLGDKRERLPSI